MTSNPWPNCRLQNGKTHMNSAYVDPDSRQDPAQAHSTQKSLVEHYFECHTTVQRSGHEWEIIHSKVERSKFLEYCIS